MTVNVTNKLVRPRTKCSRESEECGAEQELNGLEAGEDAMTDEEGEGVEGEGQAGTADWRVRAGPRNKLIARERGKSHEATHMPFRDWCAHCMMGRGRTPSPHVEAKERGLAEETNNGYGLFFSSQIPLRTLRRHQMSQCRALRLREDRHQNSMSSAALKKGIEERWACGRVARFINSFGYKEITLKSGAAGHNRVQELCS